MDKFKDEIEYKGYIFSSDGTITSPRGRIIEGYFFTYPYSHITLRYEGKSHKVLRAKLVYELFYGEEVTRKHIVRFKDGNTKNCAPDNLYLESRKDFSEANPHTNKRKFSKMWKYSKRY